MKSKILYIACFVMIWSSVLGQQGIPSSLLTFNPYFEHSAYGGMERTLAVTLQTRSTWSQLEGRPSTLYLGGHMPVYSWKGSIGSDILTQGEGNLRLSQLRASYNYVSPLLGGLISLGGRLGISQIRLDGDRIRTPQGSYIDGNINHRDPILTAGLQNGVGGLWEVSAFYTRANISVMASLADLIPLGQKVGKANYSQDKNFHFLGQYSYPITQNILLINSISLRTNFYKLQSEVSTFINYNVKNYAGFVLRGYSAKTIDALGIVAGHKVNQKFSLYYAFDIGLSGLRTVHDGTHDLIVRINLDPLFGKNLPPKVTYNPRFL